MTLFRTKGSSVSAALALAWACLIVWAEAGRATAGNTDPAPGRLDDATMSALERDGRARLWVYFTDKGEDDREAFARALGDAGSALSTRSRERRAKLQGGIFVPEYGDLPVRSRYLQGIEETGAVLRRPSRWLNAVSVEVDLDGARKIARLPYVRRIEPVQAMAPQLEKPASYGLSLGTNTAINAVAAHDSGYSAAGMIVAIFDTGFRKDHTVLSPLKRFAEWDFVDSNGETANEAGDEPNQWIHGTGCWSILGGYKPGTFVGPAYNASFVLAKTHDIAFQTNETVDLWLAAAEWVDSIGVDLLSTSMVALVPPSTLDGRTTPMAIATNTLTRHGILVVAAMGNSAPCSLCMWTPSDCDSMISVGSTNASNVISNFSSPGPTLDGRGKPDLVAQGQDAAWADASCTTCMGGYSGTSLSTPLVAGAAALVMEAHPEWNAQQVRYALKVTADKASNPDSTTYGWGKPNIVKAIYGSPLGPPVYPKPFSLVTPAAQSSVPSTPVTFRWREAVDIDGVLYQVQLRKVSSGQVVFTETTADTFWEYSGLLDSSAEYEWTVSATDNSSHTRICREPFRFTFTGAVPLTISAPGQVQATEGGTVTITATATDDSGQTITITAAGSPPGLSFSHNPTVPPAAASLSGTLGPTDTAGSPYTVTWIASDGVGSSDTTTTTVTVGVATAVPVSSAGPPRVLRFRNRPNPFQAATWIELQLEGHLPGAPIAVRIYDVHGRHVRTLVEGAPWRSATLSWDGATESGERAAAGVYHYRLEAGSLRLNRRLVLLK